MKPIHKFNSGRGATLCHKCKVIISEGMTDHLYCEKCSGVPTHPYKLTRDDDGRTCVGNKIGWIAWNEDRTFKEMLDEPQVGASCIVDPDRGDFFTWMTTAIESFTIDNNIIKFKTSNSCYTLEKLT